LLKVENLNQHYGSSHTLRNVGFEVPDSGVMALLGRNGVGKSTLLKCLMGVLPASGGKVLLDGKDITRYPPFARVRLGMGYVPQGREIFPRLTVEENLLVGLAGKSNGSAHHIPAEIYSMFPVLKDMKHRRGGDLSGGQQQQLAIGRALVMKPKLLILDEPTEGIQPSIIKEIERVIKTLSERGDQSPIVKDIERALAIKPRVPVRGESADGARPSIIQEIERIIRTHSKRGDRPDFITNVERIIKAHSEGGDQSTFVIDIRSVIKTLSGRGDMAILLVEQYYEFARALADHYVVLQRGEVVKSGAGADMERDGVRGFMAV
jgi:urea transport system ATP-binding protein